MPVQNEQGQWKWTQFSLRTVWGDACRDVNVPMHVPADKVRGALLQNAILAELLERLAGKGEGSPAELADRAHAAILQAASERGFLARDGGIQCPTNVALFVTARP